MYKVGYTNVSCVVKLSYVPNGDSDALGWKLSEDWLLDKAATRLLQQTLGMSGLDDWWCIDAKVQQG